MLLVRKIDLESEYIHEIVTAALVFKEKKRRRSSEYYVPRNFIVNKFTWNSPHSLFSAGYLSA